MHISLPRSLGRSAGKRRGTRQPFARDHCPPVGEELPATGYRLPAGTYLYNATRLQPDHARTSPPLSDDKCSTLSTVLTISEQGRQENSFPSDSCGRACRRTAAPGHERASIASGRRYPGTRPRHWEISLCLLPGSSTCTSISLAHFRHQTASDTDLRQ